MAERTPRRTAPADERPENGVARLGLDGSSGITIRRLRIFWEVARGPTLTEASKQLGLTQRGTVGTPQPVGSHGAASCIGAVNPSLRVATTVKLRMLLIGIGAFGWRISIENGASSVTASAWRSGW